VLFVDGAYWILQDVLTGDRDSVAVEQNFQFEQDIAVTLREGRVLADAPNGARLVVTPLDTALEPTVTVADEAPHVTYSTQYCANEKPRQFEHGRGWVARCTNHIMPAPALTWHGTARLPACVTLALLPLAPGATDEDLPGIRSEVTDGAVEWELPRPNGAAVHLRTSPAECALVT